MARECNRHCLNFKQMHAQLCHDSWPLKMCLLGCLVLSLMCYMLCRSARYRARTRARSKVNMVVSNTLLQGPANVWLSEPMSGLMKACTHMSKCLIVYYTCLRLCLHSSGSYEVTIRPLNRFRVEGCPPVSSSRLFLVCCTSLLGTCWTPSENLTAHLHKTVQSILSPH